MNDTGRRTKQQTQMLFSLPLKTQMSNQNQVICKQNVWDQSKQYHYTKHGMNLLIRHNTEGNAHTTNPTMAINCDKYLLIYIYIYTTCQKQQQQQNPVQKCIDYLKILGTHYCYSLYTFLREGKHHPKASET